LTAKEKRQYSKEYNSRPEVKEKQNANYRQRYLKTNKKIDSLK